MGGGVMDLLKVIQGYVGFFNEKKGKWKSCWAHLSRQGLWFYSYQYAEIPFHKYELSAVTRSTGIHLQRLSNVIQIVLDKSQPGNVIKLALQSNIYQDKWLSVLDDIITYHESSLRGSSNKSLSDNELEDDFSTSIKHSEEEVFIIKKSKSRVRSKKSS